MVEITFNNTPWGYEKLEIKNHAENSEICNAVSIIAWTIAGSLKNYLEDQSVTKCILNEGYFAIEIVPNGRCVVNTIFNVALIGYKQLELKYPHDVQVIEK